jgi:hypothetical protein
MSYRRPLTTPPPAVADKPWPRSLDLGELCRLDATLQAALDALEHTGYDLEHRMRRHREFRDAHTLVRAELNRRASESAVRDAVLALKHSGYFARDKTAKRAA